MASDNTLYYGDNLEILRRYVAESSVDLVYLDPPFNSNADYNVLFAEKDGNQAPAQIKAFKDTWTWDQQAAAEYAEVLRGGHDRVARTLKGMYDVLGRSDMIAYLSMMALRLIELRRVLKPTGSIYLHCDPTASHYLKILMDAVFGPENFRSEIVWQRTNAHNYRSRHFGRVHDTILFYSRSNVYKWNQQYVPYGKSQLARYMLESSTGRYYTGQDLTMRGNNAARQFDWRGSKPPPNRVWGMTIERLEELWVADMILKRRDGTPRLDGWKVYLDQRPGKPPMSVWSDIPRIGNTSGERLGYPTQKPLGLLERILQSSSNEGDLVLDPFCGCGTTVAAAQRLGRRWIGVDITHLAVNLIKVRLADTFGVGIAKTYRVVGEPTDLAGAQALAAQDKYQFQYWALGLVGARPVEEKKGADRGVDGRLYLVDRTGETATVIISVKGGNVTVAQIRDLRGVVEREGAAVGVFLTLEPPTAPMRKEAADAGVWQTRSVAGTSHPRLQIVTIDDLLAGRRIDLPPQQEIRSFKQAPKARSSEKQQERLF